MSGSVIVAEPWLNAGKVAAAVGDLRSREERWKRNAESCVLMQAVMGRAVGAPSRTGIWWFKKTLRFIVCDLSRVILHPQG